MVRGSWLVVRGWWGVVGGVWLVVVGRVKGSDGGARGRECLGAWETGQSGKVGIECMEVGFALYFQGF